MLTDLRKSHKKKIAWNFGGPEKLLKWDHVHTVCEESACPNRAECSREKTATFLIGGRYCTRNCSFCRVEHGKPPSLAAIAEQEKADIIEAVEKLGLQFAVITSVTRDDDQTGLARHFAGITATLKKMRIGVELLIPDFSGDESCLDTIAGAGPDVIAHNVETVKELTPQIRSRATYEKSLKVLQYYRTRYPKIVCKTGIMVGLGETRDQLERFFHDIQKTGIDMLTIGQYLRPGEEQAEVARFYTPEEFEVLRQMAVSAGIPNVESGFYVRSSYRARSLFEERSDG